MEINFNGHCASSILFLSQLRRMIPFNHRPKPHPPKPSPSLTDLQNSVQQLTNLPSHGKAVSSYSALKAIQNGESFPSSVLSQSILPSDYGIFAADHSARIYGARFVDEEGNRFITACQDRCIRVYENTKSDNPSDWKCTHEIAAIGVNWTITDFDVSKDGRWLAYSSINRCVHIVDLNDRNQPHISLDIPRPIRVRVFVWSLKWSHDGRELIIGAVSKFPSLSGMIYIYNVESSTLTECIEGHESDVNSVCYLQNTDSNLFLSGSDDILAKMWDKRDLRSRRQNGQNKSCGVFVGHQYGITFVSSKNDGKFFISNGKDQMIKLWDARKCMSNSNTSSVKFPPRNATFDYMRSVQSNVMNLCDSSGYYDDSVITYSGSHETSQTLMRAYFSPIHTTGQKYIYCGSNEGCCVIYETMTGKFVKKLGKHMGPVRDVSWHPYSYYLTTASWDGSVVVWPSHDEYYRSESQPRRVQYDEDKIC